MDKPLRHKFTLVVVLLTAVALRTIGLYNISPPGLEHDEVANWLIDRAILDGNHAIYFTDAYGHEAFFHYLQTVFVALLGDHAFALRLPAAFAGLILIAVTYALIRRLFGRSIAIWSAALLAVLFWPVFYSRLGLRAITLPVMAGLAAYFWWRGWFSLTQSRQEAKITKKKTRVSADFLLAGVFAGLAIHTYMAARALPIFFALFTVYLFLFHRGKLKLVWREMALFWLTFGLVAAPLVIYLQTNPSAEFRVSEVDAPLRALGEGDLTPILTNALRIAGGFGWRGDPLWRQNVADAPVFDPLTAVIFYAGVLLSLWRWRDARYAFLLLWLGASIIPSLVTVDAPSTIRMILLLPILTVFPIVLMHNLGWLSTVFPKLSTDFWKFVGNFILTLSLIWSISLTIRGVFVVWPMNDEVEFVWQKALTATAVVLDQSPSTDPVAIGGWSPATMDEPTMILSLKRDDLSLRYFGSDSTAVAIETVIIPHSDGRSRLTHPNVREIAAPLQTALRSLGATNQTFTDFTLWDMAYTTPTLSHPLSQSFSDQLVLLGYDLIPNSQSSILQLVTYWQVVADADGPRRFFAHALNANGDIISQHDSLDAPAMHWQAGDLIIQYHALSDLGETVRLGVYNPDTCDPGPCQNLLTAAGEPFILLPKD